MPNLKALVICDEQKHNWDKLSASLGRTVEVLDFLNPTITEIGGFMSIIALIYSSKDIQSE